MSVPWLALAARAIEPPAPPLGLPVVDTRPPADTSMVLPAASWTTGPLRDTDPPSAALLGVVAVARPVGTGDAVCVR